MSEARKIGKIAREAQKLNAMVFKETNIGSSELELIHYVRHHPDTTQQEAANELHVEKGAVTKRVRSLVKKGYLICRQDIKDKRKHLLYPTEKAQALKQSRTSIEAAFYDWLLEDLSQEEKETFQTILDKVYAKSKKESRSHFPNVMQRIQTL